jgi:hypothetical protein
VTTDAMPNPSSTKRCQKTRAHDGGDGDAEQRAEAEDHGDVRPALLQRSVEQGEGNGGRKKDQEIDGGSCEQDLHRISGFPAQDSLASPQ